MFSLFPINDAISCFLDGYSFCFRTFFTASIAYLVYLSHWHLLHLLDLCAFYKSLSLNLFHMFKLSHNCCCFSLTHTARFPNLLFFILSFLVTPKEPFSYTHTLSFILFSRIQSSLLCNAVSKISNFTNTSCFH